MIDTNRWGVEMGLGLILEEHETNQTCIVRVSTGGKGLDNWYRSDFEYLGYYLLTNQISIVKNELQQLGYTPLIKELIYIGSEYDTMDSARSSQFYANMTNLINSLRIDLGNMDLPIALVELSSKELHQLNMRSGRKAIRADMEDIASNDPHVRLIETDDLQMVYEAELGNWVHYGGESLLRLGARIGGHELPPLLTVKTNEVLWNSDTELYEQTVTVSNQSKFYASGVVLEFEAISNHTSVYNTNATNPNDEYVISWPKMMHAKSALDFRIQYFASKPDIMPWAEIRPNLVLYDNDDRYETPYISSNHCVKIHADSSCEITWEPSTDSECHILYTDNLVDEKWNISPITSIDASWIDQNEGGD